MWFYEMLAFYGESYACPILSLPERLLSIPILDTLVLALRRKLERRVRH
jgi:hypothetical protein